VQRNVLQEPINSKYMLSQIVGLKNAEGEAERMETERGGHQDAESSLRNRIQMNVSQ